MRQVLFGAILVVFLAACGGGGSDSGGMDTIPGTDIPSRFVGVYTGTLTVTASALGLSESTSFAITVTVTADGMLRFDGDEPDETFTVGLTNDGRFRGTLPADIDDCNGELQIEGQVDGSNVTGQVSGEGQCTEDGLTITVSLAGSVSASR